MSYIRAVKIMAMTLKQLKNSAKIMKTTPTALRSQARSVIKKKNAQAAARPRSPKSMGDFSRLTKERITGVRPKRR